MENIIKKKISELLEKEICELETILLMNVGDSQYTTPLVLVPRGPPARSRDLSGDKRDSGFAGFPIPLPGDLEMNMGCAVEAACSLPLYPQGDQPTFSLPSLIDSKTAPGTHPWHVWLRVPYDRGKCEPDAVSGAWKRLDHEVNCLPTDDEPCRDLEYWIPEHGICTDFGSKDEQGCRHGEDCRTGGCRS